MTRNITLAVEEDVLERAKIFAAHRRTTVNRLVRDYLRSLVGQTGEVDEARARLLELAREKRGDMGERPWRREDLYDR